MLYTMEERIARLVELRVQVLDRASEAAAKSGTPMPARDYAEALRGIYEDAAQTRLLMELGSLGPIARKVVGEVSV